METARSTTPARPDPAAARVAPSPQDLHGRARTLARSTYLLVVVLALGLFAFSIPPRFQMANWGDLGLQPEQSRSGEVVLEPIQGLAADEAGVRPGDVLVSVEGVPVQTAGPPLRQLRRLLGPVGTPVDLEVRAADGTLRHVTVTRDARGLEQLDIPLGSLALPRLAVEIVVMLGFGVPALVIYWRRSRDGLALFVSLVLVLLGFTNTSALDILALTPEVEGVALDGVLVLTYLFWLAYSVSTFLLFFVFPNGRLVPGWTRFLVPAVVLWSALLPLPLPVNLWTWPYALVDLGLTAVCLFAQVYRYRNVSSHQERQQTKWVVLGLGLVILGAYAPLWTLSAFPSLTESNALLFRLGFIHEMFVSSLLLLVLSLTFSVSIFRYRLYDVDLFINRTLVYGLVTAIMAGLFATSTKLGEKVFVELTGEKSEATAVLATLIVVSSFTPVKELVQTLVARYFKEAPDPGKRLRAFVAGVQSRAFAVEADQAARSLLEEVIAAYQVRSGAVYLASDGRLEPVHATREWDGEVQLDLPLAGRDGQASLGVIALGPRGNGSGYSAQDLTLLEEAARVVGVAIEEDRAVLRLRRGLDQVA